MNGNPTRPRTAGELLRSATRRHPGRDAYVHGPERLSYAELDAAADRMARRLLERDVVRGDVVTFMLPSSIRFAVAYLGTLRVGAIASAVNLRLGTRERDHILERTNSRVVIDDGWQWDLDDAVPSPDDLPAVDPTDVACIVWTSGTTAAPKGAVYDHVRLEAISRNMGVLTEPGDRRLSVLPFPHVGYMTRIWDELAHGTTLVLTGEPWSAAETLRLVRDEDITVMTGVPTQWTLLLEHEGLARTDFDRVRVAGIGGAAVAPELVHRIRAALGCSVIQRYTSTEAGISTGTDLDDPDEVVAHTVGRPAPEVELRILDEDGCAVPQGEVGEVVLRSPTVMREYWRDPESTAAAIDPEGFLHTGDLGFVGDDGNLRLVGRSKDMYVRGGYNVYPAEIEATLVEHPAIERAAVVGIPDRVLGEVGVAFVTTNAGAREEPVDRDVVIGWLEGRLADYKWPHRVLVVDELPTTSMLKIDKRALAERAREER